MSGGSITENTAAQGSCMYLKEQTEAELISGNIDFSEITAK